VFALNLQTDLIYGQDVPTGLFDFQAAAQSGDVFTIWYMARGVVSEAVQVEVPYADQGRLRAPDGGVRPDAGADADEPASDAGD
jgi:hypothetical protein